ncbi:MAG: hypothetical protein ACRD42_01395 [Nitrososphaeraceae archaeon]
MDDKLTKNSDDIALLTRKERAWLLGKIEVSNATKRDLLYRIRKKIGILYNQEIPLLVQNRIWGVNPNQPNHSLHNGVVTNDDNIVTNPDNPCLGRGRWSSLVKIPRQTWRKPYEIESGQASKVTKFKIMNANWAGSDSNQRPPPCQV